MTSSSHGIALSLLYHGAALSHLLTIYGIWTTVSLNGVGLKPTFAREVIGSEWRPSSTGVSNSHRWQTHVHAFIQHPNIMVESIIGGDLDFDFVPRPVHNELLSPYPFCLLH